MASVFDEIKQYVGFGDADAERLRELLPFAEPHFPRFSDHFYACIQAHPDARAAITGGEAQIERLKKTLIDWMRSGLEGPYDETFYERRARIGRVHVKIALPQRYMVTAINVMRLDFRGVIDDAFEDPWQGRAISDAVDKLFDLELAIMLETYKEDSERRVRDTERLAAIGQLAATIGHDLRNPIGVIESSVFILRKKLQGDEHVDKHLDRISRQLGVSGAIIEDLLDMARDRQPKLEVVEADRFITSVLAEAELPESIDVERTGAPGITLQVDPGLVKRALANVLHNARQALGPRGGTIIVDVQHDPEQVRLTVIDSGPGFSDEMLEAAFEPLVTNKAAGTGLGLALVRRVVERHGGEAKLANEPEGGARVSLHFPVA